MHEDLIKRLRELQAITEHCSEHSCFECENRELCDEHDNKTLSGTYKEAADVIEELTVYVQQIEELHKDGYYLQKTKMTDYGQAIITGSLPQPPKKVGKLHVDKHGVASITEISEEEVKNA